MPDTPANFQERSRIIKSQNDSIFWLLEMSHQRQIDIELFGWWFGLFFVMYLLKQKLRQGDFHFEWLFKTGVC